MLVIKALQGKLTEKHFNLVGLGGMLIIIVTIVSCWVNFFKDAIPDVVKKLKLKCRKKRRVVQHEGI